MSSEIDYTNTVSIPLSKGFWSLIDVDDYERVSSFSWHARLAKNGAYGRTIILENGKKINRYLHQFILGTKAPNLTDHINRNGLDNRKENLRISDKSQNNMNRYVFSLNKKTSKYKGVEITNNGQWKAAITHYKKRYYLGLYKTQEEAALAYNKAAIELWGEYAYLNDIATLGIKVKEA